MLISLTMSEIQISTADFDVVVFWSLPMPSSDFSTTDLKISLVRPAQ